MPAPILHAWQDDTRPGGAGFMYNPSGNPLLELWAKPDGSWPGYEGTAVPPLVHPFGFEEYPSINVQSSVFEDQCAGSPESSTVAHKFAENYCKMLDNKVALDSCYSENCDTGVRSLSTVPTAISTVWSDPYDIFPSPSNYGVDINPEFAFRFSKDVYKMESFSSGVNQYASTGEPHYIVDFEQTHPLDFLINLTKIRRADSAVSSFSSPFANVDFENDHVCKESVLQSIKEHGHVTWRPAGTDSSFDDFIKVEIKNKTTGQVMKELETTQTNFTWDISDLTEDELLGTYVVQATYNKTVVRMAENVIEYDTENVATSNLLTFTLEQTSRLGGCTDVNAVNYIPYAEFDDGTCKYESDCDRKYLNLATQTGQVNMIKLNPGYNIISYPLTFSSVTGLNFFEVLNNSYYEYDESGNVFNTEFKQDDFIVTYYEEKTYAATYIDNEWSNVSSAGTTLQTVQPGMGFVINVSEKSAIIWSVE